MNRIITVILVLLLFSTALVADDRLEKGYDSVLESLARLDSTLQIIRTDYNTKAGGSEQIAGVEDIAAPPVSNETAIYRLASDFETLVDDLKDVVSEAKKENSVRPKNPPEVKHGKIQFTGFTHQQYYSRFGDNTQSSFVSKRARLGIKGSINEYVRAGITGEFAGSPKLLDAVLTISPAKSLSLKAGQYKPPFGADFLTSATALPFIYNSRAKELGTDRDIGASLDYLMNWPGGNSLKFSAGLFNGSGINSSDINDNKNFIFRTELKLAGMFTVAPNLIAGKTNQVDSLKEDLNVYGASIAWNWKGESFAAEYIYSESGDLKKSGWYIWGGHSFYTKARFLPEIQILARYEQYDSDLDLNDDRINRLTLGTNLYIDGNYARLQANYHINTEEGTSIKNNEFITNIQVAF